MTTKVCSRCKEEKDISEFHFNRNHRYGHNYYCKQCASHLRRENYLKYHPNAGVKNNLGLKEFWKNATEEFRKKHADKCRIARIKAWEEKNPLPENYRRRTTPWGREKIQNRTLPTPCRALRVHAKQLKDDPERLTTDFIKKLAGIKTSCEVTE